jgi:hypothetical protein
MGRGGNNVKGKTLKKKMTSHEETLEAMRQKDLTRIKPWTSLRPKPDVDNFLWGVDQSEALCRYIDWHGKHPHCYSPRPVEFDEDGKLMKNKAQFFDEEDPKLLYGTTPLNLVPTIHEQYCPPNLGSNCLTVEVIKLSSTLENDQRLAALDMEDKFYSSSVRDNLELNHADGFHTPQKIMRCDIIRTKENSDKRYNFSSNMKGSAPKIIPAFKDFKEAFENNKDKMIALAFAEEGGAGNNKEGKVKTGPFQTFRYWSKYTKDGKYMNTYRIKELEDDLKFAIEMYETEGRTPPPSIIEPKMHHHHHRKHKDDSVSMDTDFVNDETSLENSTNKLVPSLQLDTSGFLEDFDESEFPSFTPSKIQLNSPSQSPQSSSRNSHNLKISTFTPIPDPNDPNPSHTPIISPLSSPQMSPLSSSRRNSLSLVASFTPKTSSRRPSLKQQLFLDSITKPMDSLSKPSDSIKKPKSAMKQSHVFDDFEDGSMSVGFFGIDEEKEELDMIPEIELGNKYDQMTKKLGGPDKLENMSQNIIKYSEWVRKKAGSKIHTGGAQDEENSELGNACEQGKVIKMAMLLVGGLSPDIIYNDMPLVTYIFQKAIEMDNQANTKTKEDKTCTDRDLVQKVLDTLVKFNVDLDLVDENKRDRFGCIHYAAINGNLKMIQWLIKNGADIKIFCKNDIERQAIHYASIYGYVYVINELIRFGVKVNVLDGEKSTGLHHACQNGHTRIALYLVRIGAEKKLVNANGYFPTSLAAEYGNHATAQVVLCANRPRHDSKPVLNWIRDRIDNPPQKSLGDTLKTVGNVIGSIGNILGAGIGAIGSALGGIGGFIRGFTSTPKVKVDMDKALNDDVMPF